MYPQREYLCNSPQVTSLAGDSEMVRLFQGWLVKEPLRPHFFSHARRRFFVLTDDVLEW